MTQGWDRAVRLAQLEVERIDLLVILGEHSPRGSPSGSTNPDLAPDHDALRMRIQIIRLLPKSLGHRDIIAVHPGDELAPGLVDQLIERRAPAPGSAGT